MSIVFNSHDIGAAFICSAPKVQWSQGEPTLQTIPGRDGALLTDTRQGTLSISFTAHAMDGTREGRRRAFSMLAQWLDVEDAAPLYLPDMVDPDGEPLYYMAIPNSASTLNRYLNADGAELAFTALSPAAYGQTKTETLTSGGDVSIYYSGTYPAGFTATGEVVADPASGRYGIRNQKGDYLHIKTTGENIPIHWIMTGGDTWGDVLLDTWREFKAGGTWAETTDATLEADTAANIWLDTTARKVRINDAYTVPTLDSNYFVLEPGNNDIKNDLGSGDVIITYTERWL